MSVRQQLAPLNWQTPIVDPKTGFPTTQFIRILQMIAGNDDATVGGLATKVDKTTEVIAGIGLDGGGALSGNVTLDLANTAVTPGTYGDATHSPRLTVDQQGRIVDGEDVPISGGGGGDSFLYMNTVAASYPAATTGNVTLMNYAMPANTLVNVGDTLEILSISELASAGSGTRASLLFIGGIGQGLSSTSQPRLIVNRATVTYAGSLNAIVSWEPIVSNNSYGGAGTPVNATESFRRAGSVGFDPTIVQNIFVQGSQTGAGAGGVVARYFSVRKISAP